MSTTVKLKYALKDGVLTSIDDLHVKSGLNNYYCPDPNCKAELIAKKGKIKAKHFAHKPGFNSCYGLETSLHLLAKMVIESIDKILLPCYEVDYGKLYEIFKQDISNLEDKYRFPVFKELMESSWSFRNFIVSVNEGFAFNKFKLFKETTIDLTKYIVESEKKINSKIPDISLTRKSDNKQLFIEIGVTHLIDEDKKNFIINNDLSFLEIDLSGYYRNFDNCENDILLFFKDKTEFKKKELSKYLTIKERWINISNLNFYLNEKRGKVLQKFEKVLLILLNFYNETLVEIFNENYKFREEISKNDTLKEFSPFSSNQYAEELSNLMYCDIVYKFFKNYYKNTGNAKKISENRKRIEKEKDEFSQRFRDYVRSLNKN